MSKWMCDVIGRQPVSEDCMKNLCECEGITHQSLEKFIGDRGNLPTNVKEYIKSLGYQWSDSGGGGNSWHIGVPFDDFTEACAYISKVTIKFQKAINSGLLTFKLMTWSPKDWRESHETQD